MELLAESLRISINENETELRGKKMCKKCFTIRGSESPLPLLKEITLMYNFYTTANLL